MPPETVLAPAPTTTPLPGPGSTSSPGEEGEPVRGPPTLHVDASVMHAHHRRLQGAVVHGSLHGLPIMELDILVEPWEPHGPGSAEAEWRALLVALHHVRGERGYLGPLRVLTDARTSADLWELARETDEAMEAPPEPWRAQVAVAWVPRARLREADRALRFWMRFVVWELLGGGLRDALGPLGLPEDPGASFRVRLSLTGREVHAWVEAASDDAGAELEALSTSSERK